MNYLAHARELLGRPWAVVGAALPDWLRVLDRRIRLRPGSLPPPAPGADAVEREIREGIRLHHEDDRWFHRAAAFRRETRELARAIRARFPDRPERRMRASFYSHILLEMLLDSALVSRDPDSIRRYYAALAAVPPGEIVRRARSIVPGIGSDLERLVVGFRDSRFLARYSDDLEVTRRLDRVGRRMRQPPLPSDFPRIVTDARERIRAKATELITPGSPGSSGEGPGPAAR